MERRRSHLVWEVRTDFGTVRAGRTAILRKSDRFSQGSTHPRVDPPEIGFNKIAAREREKQFSFGEKDTDK